MLNLGFAMQYKHKTGLFWLWAALPALAGIGCGGEDTSSSPESVDESDPTVVADTYALTSENRLVYFSRASGGIRSSAEISGLAAGESLVGVDFRPAGGELFALATTGNLYTVDTATGAATLKSTLVADTTDTNNLYTELDGTVFGVNFNPVADRLRVVSDSGQNLRINVDTGATTTDANLNPGAPSITTAAYSNSFSTACRTRLYVIDTSTNTLFLQDPPNAGTLTEIGALSLTSAPGAVFEIITLSGSDRELSNRALALLPAPTGAMVYDLDLNNGDLLGGRALRLRDGESLRGVSAAPPETAPVQAPGELVGVSVENQVVSFNRGAPGKLCTRAPVAGLGAGEDVLGIDLRPADGDLYALSSAGKLYTVDVASGEATLKSTLLADAMDTTEPFTSLPATDFGVGFNPVPDRLRVVSRTGQNLRINVDTGATTTDAALSPASMAVQAVAYTNAYAGATSTALYAVDVASASLTLIGANPATGGACPGDAANPNCGNVTAVGPLGVANMVDVDGFDIDGAPGAAATGFLALRIGDGASSSLYVIDLATGAAAPPPGVANPTIGGGQLLRDITLATNPIVTPAP
jgi:hypothetical protein